LQTEIEKNQQAILQFLYEAAKGDKTDVERVRPNGGDIRKATKLNPTQINDAVDLLQAAGLVDWYQSLGTEPYRFYGVRISAHGKLRAQKAEHATLAERVLPEASVKQTKTSISDRRNVFVVHGRNLQAHDELLIFLRSIDLHPLEWSQLVTATGRGTPYIGEILDKAFSQAQAVIVLMTPDDEGQLRKEFWKAREPTYETELTPQARLNVLFEAGMAMGRCDERTIMVELGIIRPFSDIAGRHVVKLDDTAEKRQELANRLETAGCKIDTSGTDWLKAGKFKIV